MTITKSKIGDICSRDKIHMFLQRDNGYTTLGHSIIDTIGDVHFYPYNLGQEEWPSINSIFWKDVPEEEIPKLTEGLLSKDKDTVLFYLAIINNYKNNE